MADEGYPPSSTPSVIIRQDESTGRNTPNSESSNDNLLSLLTTELGNRRAATDMAQNAAWFGNREESQSQTVLAQTTATALDGASVSGLGGVGVERAYGRETPRVVESGLNVDLDSVIAPSDLSFLGGEVVEAGLHVTDADLIDMADILFNEDLSEEEVHHGNRGHS